MGSKAKEHRAEVRRMTRRLVALHAETSPADLADGLAWYGRAQLAARDMAVGDDVARAAAVIAHLSPRQTWSQNVAAAARMLQAAESGDDCPAVGISDPRCAIDQRTKAWLAATGAAAPDANHGPKTGAFWANIMGDVDRVCVDSWAARAATGDATVTNVSPALYRRVEAAYVAAARIVGLAPRDLQAAVWVHVRGAAD